MPVAAKQLELDELPGSHATRRPHSFGNFRFQIVAWIDEWGTDGGEKINDWARIAVYSKEKGDGDFRGAKGDCG